jgi:exodeoxyribonuclease VII small subunit
MAKDTKATNGAPVQYGEVVHRLEEVVKRLEGGELSLEDSLKAFEEGITLVRKGEKLLGDAEKRIEQLLSEDGEDKAVPLELPATGADTARSYGKAPPTVAKPNTDFEDDVPF